MAATQAESQRSEPNVDQNPSDQLSESRNALLQNGTDKTVGRVPPDGVVNTKSKSPMSADPGQPRDAGEAPGHDRPGERPVPDQYGQYRYPEGADPYYPARPGFPGKPRPPPQQRFFPGQAVSQAPGPTPTLNSLLQSSGAPPHRYPNSYDQPPAGYGPAPGWPPRPMPPYNPQGAPYRNSTPPRGYGGPPYGGGAPGGPQQPPGAYGPPGAYPQRYPPPQGPPGAPNSRPPFSPHPGYERGGSPQPPTHPQGAPSPGTAQSAPGALSPTQDSQHPPHLPPGSQPPPHQSNLSSGIEQSSKPPLSVKHKLPGEEATNVKKSRSTEQVQELMARYTDKEQSGNARSPYSPALRSFALTLHYYSPKAYEYVRQTFNTCLPHASTLRKWYSSVHGDPGFTSESFAALKAKAETTDYIIHAALTMDEMAIRRRIEWDGQRFHGCVEFGSSTENDLLAEAKEALVFLITAINANFKIPVAYFLVDGVTGTQRADLVKQCLEKIHETGIQVVSLTFDGCASNVAMMHELGCSLANNNTQFNHPITDDPVVAILDPSHMVKLIRNTFQMYNTFIDREGNKICWSYLQELNKMQETEKFHLANKLRNLHINYQNQKMKVKLATQMFSASVADALNFCEKQLKLRAFVNCAPTAFFITTINNLFDIYNSRNMFQQGFKRPLNERNVDDIMSYINSAIEYLSSIKDKDGTLLVKTPRKTGFLGFIACAEAIKFLYSSLIQTKLLVYLPFYKLSQDHLELLFRNIRSHGGFNNNPTAKQFKAAFKKLLVHVEVKNFDNGNCTALEHMSILNCSSPITRINATSQNVLDNEYDVSIENSQEEDEEEEAISLLSQNMTEFSTQIIGYIAGNVVRVLQQKINCEECIASLHSAPDSDKHKFIIFKDKGGLIYPSKDVISICKVSETVVRSYVDKSVKVNKDILVTKIMRNLVGCSLFTENFSHGLGAYPTANHIVDLKKSIIEKYINIRLHFLIKTRKSNLTKRQLLNKYIIFQGQ